MKKIFIFFAATSTFLSYSQDPIFLNTNQSLVYLNPSFAGSNGGVRDQLSYRSQWPGLSSNYVTYLNSFDVYIKPLKAGVAVSVIHDDAGRGTLKTRQFSITYAQHLSFADGKLKIIPSLQLGGGMKNLDRDNLHFGDMIDSRYGVIWNDPQFFPNTTKLYFNASGGFLANFKKDLYVGAYVFNFNQPNIGLLGVSKLPPRLLLHASYNIHLSEQTSLQIFYRYNQQQNIVFNQLSANAIFKNHFIAGVRYLSNYLALVNLGYRWSFFTLMGGYDINFSKYGLGAGSWEIHTSFSFANKEKFKAKGNFENY